MRKIKYKEISPEMDKLAKPANTGRVAIGMDKSIGEYYFLLIEDLMPYKNQARKYFFQEEIDALAESIKEHGIRQPLTVLSSEENIGKYEVISGERRLRAAELAGLKKVPCIILTDKNDTEEIALIENLHRQDLHPIELGAALNALLNKGLFSTQLEMSKKLALKESVVSECLKLVSLDSEIKDYLIKNSINSRDLLRRIAKVSLDNNEVKRILGLSSEKRENFSVIRVMYTDNQFKLQFKGIDKLTQEQKGKLKSELNFIMKSL